MEATNNQDLRYFNLQAQLPSDTNIQLPGPPQQKQARAAVKVNLQKDPEEKEENSEGENSYEEAVSFPLINQLEDKYYIPGGMPRTEDITPQSIKANFSKTESWHADSDAMERNRRMNESLMNQFEDKYYIPPGMPRPTEEVTPQSLKANFSKISSWHVNSGNTNAFVSTDAIERNRRMNESLMGMSNKARDSYSTFGDATSYMDPRQGNQFFREEMGAPIGFEMASPQMTQPFKPIGPPKGFQKFHSENFINQRTFPLDESGKFRRDQPFSQNNNAMSYQQMINLSGTSSGSTNSSFSENPSHQFLSGGFTRHNNFSNSSAHSLQTVYETPNGVDHSPFNMQLQPMNAQQQQMKSLNMMQRGGDKFNFPQGNFQGSPANFQRTPSGFQSNNPANFQGNQPNFQSNQPNFQGNMSNFQNSSPSFNGPPTNFQGAPQNFQNAPQNFQNTPQNFQSTPQNFQNTPQNFQNTPQNFQGNSSNFMAPQQNFQGTPANFHSSQKQMMNPAEMNFPSPMHKQNQVNFSQEQEFNSQAQAQQFYMQQQQQQNSAQQNQFQNQSPMHNNYPVNGGVTPSGFSKFQLQNQPARFQQQSNTPSNFGMSNGYGNQQFFQQKMPSFASPAMSSHVAPSPSSMTPMRDDYNMQHQNMMSNFSNLSIQTTNNNGRQAAMMQMNMQNQQTVPPGMQKKMEMGASPHGDHRGSTPLNGKKKFVKRQKSNEYDDLPSSSPSKGKKKQEVEEETDPKELEMHKLIEEYESKADNAQKFEVIKGRVSEIVVTQTGSRFIQKQLNKGNMLLVDFLLEEVIDDICDLMVDNYGNYFCQKLLLSCSPPQRLKILKKISMDYMKVCKDKKGTHTVQAIIDLVNLEEEEKMVKELLTGRVLDLALDAQGTHVIQKVIICFLEPKRQFIFDELLVSFLEISTNSNGLCVVKKLVANTTIDANIKAVVSQIDEHIIELVQNPYGNYAIQTMIENWNSEQCKPIFKKLYNRVAQLSIQKFSSNVIEKCLEKADPETKADLILEIASMERLAGLMKNSYGNYVVQKALSIAKNDLKERLAKAIASNIPQISDKKLRMKWQYLLAKSLKDSNIDIGKICDVATLEEIKLSQAEYEEQEEMLGSEDVFSHEEDGQYNKGYKNNGSKGRQPFNKMKKKSSKNAHRSDYN